MRVDPFVLRRKVQEAKVVEVSDPAYPELVVRMYLKALGVVEEYLAQDRYEELVETYLEGGEDRPAVSFPAIDGQKVPLSKSLCESAAILEVMQCPEHEADFYRAEQLIGIAATLPEAWRKLIECADELREKVSKKVIRATTQSSCGLPSSLDTGTPG